MMKKRMTSFIFVILMPLVAVLVLGGVWFLLQVNTPGADSFEQLESNEERMVIGLVLKAMDSDHWKGIRSGAIQAAKDYDADVIILAPDDESDMDEQFQMIRDLADTGIDALCVAPSDSSKILPLFNEVHEKGIDIITVDTNSNVTYHVTSFIGTNNFEAGQIAARKMIDDLNGVGNVIVVAGNLRQNTHKLRVDGFVDVIAKSDVNLSVVAEAGSDPDQAYERISSLLFEYNDNDGIFVTNALMTLGVVEALKNYEMEEDIQIIGFDIQQELMALLESGELNAVISQNSYDMGYEAVLTAIKVVQSDPVDKELYTESVLITKDNLSEYQYLFQGQSVTE